MTTDGTEEEGAYPSWEERPASRSSRETTDQKQEAYFLAECDEGFRPISWAGGSRVRLAPPHTAGISKGFDPLEMEKNQASLRPEKLTCRLALHSLDFTP